MTANQKSSMTTVMLKQISTKTFSSVNAKIDRIDFLRRNKKLILIVAAVWSIAVICTFFFFNTAIEKEMAEYYKSTSAEVDQLSDAAGELSLIGDILDLNRRVSEFTLKHKSVFTAVLDHENKVIAHSDPEQLNSIFEPLTDQVPMSQIGQVSIAAGKLSNGEDAVSFSRTITYGKDENEIQIGSVITGIPISAIESTLSDYRMNKMIMLALTTLVAGVAVLLLDRMQNHKEEKPDFPENSMDGPKMGPYMLRKKIAQGGMAELYKADYLRRDGFKRSLAIKRVLPHLSQNQDFINMFIREARLAALLQHPNIVQIFDFGKIQNTYFIAMEYIDGLNLGQMISTLEEGLPVDMTMFIGAQISLGLDYSHKRKDDESGEPLDIVHRDISPQNILVSFQGEVKISDFGISKARTEPSLTQAGMIKGKMGYLSPEQALGQTVDHQCDIYSLGLVLYEILTATRVYQFDSDIDAIRTIPDMEISSLQNIRPDVPDGFNDIIMKCLEKDKKLRYADAGQLHDDLMRLKSELQITYDPSTLTKFMKSSFKNVSH